MAWYGIRVRVRWTGVPTEALTDITRAYMYIWDGRALFGILATRLSGSIPHSSHLKSAPLLLPRKPHPTHHERRMYPPPSSNVLLVTENGDDVGQQIKLVKFKLSDCISEPIFCKLEQQADYTRPFGSIDDAHGHEHRESFLSKEFDFSRGMLTVPFAYDMHPGVDNWKDMVSVSGDTK